MRSLIGLLLGFALLAAGCAGDSSEPPMSLSFADEPVVLSVWAWDGVLPPSLVAAFERENPDIRVDVRTSSFDQHHLGFESALSEGGSLPDVAAIERTYLPDFLPWSDQFVDLGDFGADAFDSQYLQWRWEEGVASDGRIIGLPTDVGGLALAYRTDLFAEAGLPSDPDLVAELVESWDDLLELGEAFAASGTETRFIDSIQSLFFSRLGQETHVYVDDTGQQTLDGGVLEAWDYTVDAIDRGLSSGFTQFSPEWNAGFGDDSFAAIAAPSWMRGYIENIAPETASSWAIVSVPGVGGNWGGSQLAAPVAGENHEQAVRFVTFMTNTETQLELFRESGNFPSIPELYSRPEIIQLEDPFFGGQNVGRIYVDSVQDVPSQPKIPGQRELDRLFSEALGEVELGAEADAAWEASRARALEIIEADGDLNRDSEIG